MLKKCECVHVNVLEDLPEEHLKFDMHHLTLAQLTICSLFRLLVGAPQAAALPGQKANRTGGLYACPLTHEINDCKRVTIDEGGRKAELLVRVKTNSTIENQ